MAKRITIQLIGSIEEEGHVRLNSFISQLEAVKAALKQTERLVSGEDESSVYYRVVDLRHSSPATIVLEAVSTASASTPPTRRRRQQQPRTDHSQATVTQFFHSLKDIREKKQAPARADLQALEAFRNLTGNLDKSFSGMKLINTDESVSIDNDFREAIEGIIGPDELIEGSVTGMLEKVNLHNTARFDIFPMIGPKQVTCDFKRALREKVIASLDKFVTVSGKLRYKKLEDFPYAINAEDIVIVPPDDELPSIFDLKGMAPDLTDGRSTHEFLEAIRDAEIG
jgi:hypothetical protein